MTHYDDLMKKYGLPGHDELNSEFDIEEINAESKLILHKIRDKVHDKMDYYAAILESIVQPDTILRDIYEGKHISDSTRENAYILYKSILALARQADLARLDSSEEAQANFIKSSNEEWKALKPELMKHVQKLSNLWKKETDIKEDLSYFG
jgi:hypothetical protein